MPRSRQSARSTLDENPLRSALDAAQQYIGHEFLERIAEETSAALEFDLAFVARDLSDGSFATTAVAKGGARCASTALDLSAATLFQRLPEFGPLVLNNHASLQCPSDPVVVTGGFESLVLVPLTLSDGRRVGCLGLLDRRPLANETIDRYVLHLIGQRCAAEIERLDRDLALGRAATIDLETGLPNPLLFRDRLITALERARRTRQLVALLDIELWRDRGKGADIGGAEMAEGSAAEDSGWLRGRPEGVDTAVAEASRRLRTAVRASDSIGRLSPRGFGVALEALNEWRNVESASVSVYQALTHAPLFGDGGRVGARVGVAVYPDDGLAADELMSCAGRAKLGRSASGVAFYGGR
jgi:GGDEF domain-containing protein